MTPAHAQPFGSACGGASVPPALACGTPRLGSAEFVLELLSAPPASTCVFGLATATQALPVGPCTLYLREPILPWASVTNWAGVASIPGFAIPADPTLRSATFHAQAFVLDPHGPPPGFAFTAGMRILVGD